MPFYAMAPQSDYDTYIALTKAHNVEPDAGKRYALSQQGHAIINRVSSTYSNVAGGDIICAADMASGHMEDDRPMCGGFLLDLA